MPVPVNLSITGFTPAALPASAFGADTVGVLRQGVEVQRATKVLPQTATEALFTVAGGKVLIHEIFGEVTTAIQAQATTLKLQANPTVAGSSVDMCATVDANADVVGTIYGITGTLATAMGHGLAIIGQVTPTVVQPGTIDLVTGASSTGSVKWVCRYSPIDAGATVVAA